MIFTKLFSKILIIFIIRYPYFLLKIFTSVDEIEKMFQLIFFYDTRSKNNEFIIRLLKSYFSSRPIRKKRRKFHPVSSSRDSIEPRSN